MRMRPRRAGYVTGEGFGGGRDGSLRVEYENEGDTGVGFEGSLADATVDEREWQPTKASSHQARKSHR